MVGEKGVARADAGTPNPYICLIMTMADTKPETAGKPVAKGDHVYLIDGSGYIFRAYHALPPLTRPSDGLPVGAVHGFCGMLWKLLRETRRAVAANPFRRHLRLFGAAPSATICSPATRRTARRRRRTSRRNSR